MPEIRPRLRYLGSFGLKRKVTFAETVIKMGLRRRIVVGTDDNRGLLEWTLSFKKLPGTLDNAVQLTGDEFDGAMADGLLSRARYLWDFYCARKRGPVQSFLIEDLCDDGQRRSYLVVFDESSLSYELFMVRLLSADGVTLVQVDEPDVNTLDDEHGSVGAMSDNPDVI